MSDQKTLLYSIVTYLKSLKEAEAESTSESIDIVVGLLETAFDVKDTPENFSDNSYFPLALPDIFSAGATTLEAVTPGESFASVEGNPKFESILALVLKKGFFEGAEPGSLEYVQRQAKLVQKFKSSGAGTAAISVAEAEKKAEEKKTQGNLAISSKDYEAAVDFYTG
jgi:hypothetical protein